MHWIFRVGEDGEWNIIDGILTPNNFTSYQVTSLHPFTVYSFRVVAVNEMGASLPSKESYYMVTLREGKYLSLVINIKKSKKKKKTTTTTATTITSNFTRPTDHLRTSFKYIKLTDERRTCKTLPFNLKMLNE